MQAEVTCAANLLKMIGYSISNPKLSKLPSCLSLVRQQRYGKVLKITNLPFNNPGWLGHPRFLQKMLNNLQMQIQDFPAPCLILKGWWLRIKIHFTYGRISLTGSARVFSHCGVRMAPVQHWSRTCQRAKKRWCSWPCSSTVQPLFKNLLQ